MSGTSFPASTVQGRRVEGNWVPATPELSRLCRGPDPGASRLQSATGPRASCSHQASGSPHPGTGGPQSLCRGCPGSVGGPRLIPAAQHSSPSLGQGGFKNKAL